MTREQFSMKLWKLGITATDLKNFLNDVLEKEEDSLYYIDRVRDFFNKKEIEVGSVNGFNINLFKTILNILFFYRTSKRENIKKNLFENFMPIPKKESINFAEWHSIKKDRERKEKSRKRRGFYLNGESVNTCGTDLQEFLFFYEYKRKGKKT